MKKKVIVIGGGIIGASAAYHLARDGADVTLLEQAPAMGRVATAASWAWLNASWGNPPDYVLLRMESLEQWRSLASVHPQLQPRWCGGLLWDLSADELRAYVAERQAAGYQADLISGEAVKRLEPGLAEIPSLAVRIAGEGDIEPVSATEGFIAAAMSHGARCKTNARVKHLEEKSGRVSIVLEDGAILDADEIVLAAGIATPALLKGIGIALAMEQPAGLLIHAKAPANSLRGLVMAPGVHARQRPDGVIVAGSDFTGADPGADPEQTAQDLFQRLRALLSAQVDYLGHGIGQRPTPADGFPAIGRPQGMRNLYVMLMHSGITLAPAAGNFAAREILSGERHPLLKPYHPDRLA